MPERFRFLASDPQLATVWFLEDGLMYFDGRTLVPRTPIVLDDGKFEGFEDASPLPPRNPPWTSKYEFNWRGK